MVTTPSVYATEALNNPSFVKQETTVHDDGGGGSGSDDSKGKSPVDEFPEMDNPFVDGVGGDVKNCKDLINDDMMAVFDLVFSWIKIAAAIGVIIYGCVDFARSMFAQDTIKQMEDSTETSLSKATGRFVKRLILAVLIFFTPTIVYYLLDLVLPGIGYCKI